jgi:DNA primase
MVGVEVDEARAEVRRAGRVGQDAARSLRQGRPGQGAPEGQPPAQVSMPDPRDPRFSLERETLKVVVQQPTLAASASADLGDNDFTHPAYLAIWQAVASLGGPGAAPAGEVWTDKIRSLLVERAGPAVLQVLNALAVEPPPTATVDEGYAAACSYRLQEVTALRRITELKSRLQRTNPVEQATEYNRMFGELVALESHRRTLRERAIGGGA